MHVHCDPGFVPLVDGDAPERTATPPVGTSGEGTQPESGMRGNITVPPFTQNPTGVPRS